MDAGLGADAIDNWLKSGRLFAKHRGVYRLGHEAVPAFSDEAGAVLACVPDAFLSHGSSLPVWKLLPTSPTAGRIDVTVIGRNPGSKPGIRIHRTRGLPADEKTIHQGIPITTPARSLFDAAAELPIRTLERALNEAQVLRLTTPSELLPLLARHPRHRGTRALRAAIGDGGTPALTRSEAERRFLALIRAAKLPPPRTNVRVGRHEVDFLWAAERLIVEVDGFRFHSSRHAFERDRARDADLAALGHKVVRVTWRQIVREPYAVVARIAQALVA